MYLEINGIGICTLQVNTVDTTPKFRVDTMPGDGCILILYANMYPPSDLNSANIPAYTLMGHVLKVSKTWSERPRKYAYGVPYVVTSWGSKMRCSRHHQHAGIHF